MNDSLTTVSDYYTAKIANLLGPGMWVPAVKSDNFAAATVKA